MPGLARPSKPQRSTTTTWRMAIFRASLQARRRTGTPTPPAGQTPLTCRLAVLRQAQQLRTAQEIQCLRHPPHVPGRQMRAERDLQRRHQRLRPDAVEHRGQRRGRRAGRAELLHHAALHALPRHGALDRPARLDRLRSNNAARPMTALRENSMSSGKSLAKRLVLYGVLGCMASQTALAAVTDISSIPLATSGGANILPNLLFDLDDSGSMQWDFMPDYVSPNTLASALPQSKPCMVDPSIP